MTQLLDKKIQVFFDDGTQGRVGLKTGILKDINSNYVVLMMDYGFEEIIPVHRIFRIQKTKE